MNSKNQREVKKIERSKKLETFWKSFWRHIRWRKPFSKMFSLSCHFWMMSSKNGVVFFATFAHGEMRKKDFETAFWGVTLDVKSFVATLLRTPNLFYFLEKTTFCEGSWTFWTVFSSLVQSLTEASSLPSKYQVPCDLVVSKNLVALKRWHENFLVAFTGSQFFSKS